MNYIELWAFIITKTIGYFENDLYRCHMDQMGNYCISIMNYPQYKSFCNSWYKPWTNMKVVSTLKVLISKLTLCSIFTLHLLLPFVVVEKRDIHLGKCL